MWPREAPRRSAPPLPAGAARRGPGAAGHDGAGDRQHHDGDRGRSEVRRSACAVRARTPSRPAEPRSVCCRPELVARQPACTVRIWTSASRTPMPGRRRATASTQANPRRSKGLNWSRLGETAEHGQRMKTSGTCSRSTPRPRGATPTTGTAAFTRTAVPMIPEPRRSASARWRS